RAVPNLRLGSRIPGLPIGRRNKHPCPGRSYCERTMKAEAPPKTSLPGVDDLRGLVEPELERWEVPGIELAVVQGDDVLFAGGFGKADVSRDSPVTPTTLFHHGSTGKTHTALLAAILVDEGLLEWDRPVREYLPGFRLSDPVLTDRVTIRDLLAHRTGIARHE